MPATFHLELDKKPNKQGQYQVYIRITKDRKLKRVKTSIQLNRPSDWNPNTRNGKFIRASEPNATKWNDVLADELEQAKSTFRAESSASLNAVVYNIKHKDCEKSFLDYLKTIIQGKYKVGATNAKHYQTLENKLAEYLAQNKQTDLAFSDLTPAFLSKFEAFLHTTRNIREPEKLISQNYIKTLMVKLRAVINRAINIDGLMKVDDNPFRAYKIAEVKTMKEKLEEYETDSIAALELKEGTWLWNTRNAFLFSYYCAGIRVADVLQMRWGNISESGRLCYQMGKTHKVRDIGLVDEAKAILKLYWKEGAKPTDYIFPLLSNEAEWAKYVTQEQKDTMPVPMKRKLQNQISSKNVLLNKNLKTIAKMAGITKNLSFHISRHSFTYQGMKKGIPPMILKEALGHSSLTITERYMGEFNNAEVDNALQKVFSKDARDSVGAKKDALLADLKRLDSSALADILSALKTQKP